MCIPHKINYQNFPSIFFFFRGESDSTITNVRLSVSWSVRQQNPSSSFILHFKTFKLFSLLIHLRIGPTKASTDPTKDQSSQGLIQPFLNSFLI